MRVIIVGASGRVGSEVVRALGEKHEIVTAGRSSGDLTVDYTDSESVREMFEVLGTFDALIATVGGDSVFKPYEELQDDDAELRATARLDATRLVIEYQLVVDPDALQDRDFRVGPIEVDR